MKSSTVAGSVNERLGDHRLPRVSLLQCRFRFSYAFFYNALCLIIIIFFRFWAPYQAFFWTIFRQFNSTGVAGFWVFLEFWLEFFQDFAWVLSFFMSFLEYLKKVQIFSNFWKYLMIKRLILGVPLSFPPKNWVFIQFSNNSTQLELPVFEFFRSFAWVFSRFSLSFEFFWAWVFFEMSKKKPASYGCGGIDLGIRLPVPSGCALARCKACSFGKKVDRMLGCPTFPWTWAGPRSFLRT